MLRKLCILALIPFASFACLDDSPAPKNAPSPKQAEELFYEKIGESGVFTDDGLPRWEVVSMNIYESRWHNGRQKYYYDAKVRAAKDIFYDSGKFANSVGLSDPDALANKKVVVKKGQVVDKYGRISYEHNADDNSWKRGRVTFRTTSDPNQLVGRYSSE